MYNGHEDDCMSQSPDGGPCTCSTNNPIRVRHVETDERNDAERAAREWWNVEQRGDPVQSLAALLRARDTATWAHIVTMLRQEHERCFTQQHAVDKTAGELADWLEARRPR